VLIPTAPRYATRNLSVPRNYPIRAGFISGEVTVLKESSMRARHFAVRDFSLAVATIFFCGLFLAGCDERIVTFRDRAIPIPKHATWAWRPMPTPPAVSAQRNNDNRRVTSRDVLTPQGTPVPREPDPATETARMQARTAIEQDLAKKGFVQVSDPVAADFVVDYHLAVHQHSVTVARGYGGYPGAGDHRKFITKTFLFAKERSYLTS
jgi:hypothetical protein